MGKPRVGIVGVGWGALVHTPGFRAAGYDVVALCSRNRERVEKAGEKLGIADRSTDWRSFVRRDDLDIVSVATPVDLHVEVALAALAAGKHVLCEKPVALDASSARDLYQAAAGSGRATAVAHQLRWLGARYAIWQQARAGFLGTPYYLRITQSAGYWHPSRHTQSEWMYKRGEGGGYLMGLQSHDIDYAMALLGEPVAVCADLKTTIGRRTLPDGREIDVDADDTGTLLLRMRSGATAVLSSCVVGAHVLSDSLEAFGSDGTIVMGWDGVIRQARASDAGLAVLEPSAREPVSGPVTGKAFSTRAIRALALMLEDWMPAFSGKPTPTVPSLREAWIEHQVIDAAWKSSAGAGWVGVDAA
ncbi:MAG: Gfo/Idh/MocA family protein [Gammaproteobacteria bacterium]